MKIPLLAVMLALNLLQAAPPQPSLSYFSRYRDVGIARPDVQNYIVADSELWMEARPDLADLRLYNASHAEIPYKLVIARDRSETSETVAKILNLGRAGNAAQFVLELGPDADFDRVILRFAPSKKDFATRAIVEGSDDLHSERWTQLGAYPVFDFSRENLGSNSVLRLPVSRFSFLRITIPEVDPADIQSAAIAFRGGQQARWTELPIADLNISQQQSQTVITWHEETGAPVEKLHFALDPNQTNFRRHTLIEAVAENGHRLLLGDVAISRLDMVRDNRKLHSEELDFEMNAHYSQFRVTIDNGNDPPLNIQMVQPLIHERRIYFDPKGATTLRLYYGDSKLDAPIYDYAKLARIDDSAVAATLGPSEVNPDYRGRPDDRPWTERRNWIVWIALTLAVFGLGAIALRSLKQEIRPPS